MYTAMMWPLDVTNPPLKQVTMCTRPLCNRRTRREQQSDMCTRDAQWWVQRKHALPQYLRRADVLGLGCPADMTCHHIGIGIGASEFDRSNVVRSRPVLHPQICGGQTPDAAQAPHLAWPPTLLWL